MDVIVLSSNMAQNLGSRNLIHHQKYNQVMEPQQLIVQIAKIRNTKWRSQCGGTGFRLIQLKQITVSQYNNSLAIQDRPR